MPHSIIVDRHYAGHLRWTAHGEVWAAWALTPLRFSQTAHDAAHATAAHTDLWRSLAGHETLLTGQLALTSPAEVVERMVAGVDLATCPRWAAEVEAMIDQVGELGFATRHWTLHVRLNVPIRIRARTWARSAANEIAEHAGIMAIAPTPDEVAAYRSAADRIQNSLPSAFDPTPLTEPQMVWQLRHAQSRNEPFDPYTEPDLGHLLTSSGRAAVGEPWLDPNGHSDLVDARREREARLSAGPRRRWLKVITDTSATSWQAPIVLSVAPKGMEFPESAFLANVDNPGIPVDVAIRNTIRSRTDALRSVKLAWSKLNDQVDQVDDAEIRQASQMMRVHDAAATLADYHTELHSDDKEVECQPIIMISAASLTSGDEVDDFAHRFISHEQHRRFTWARPIGAETSLWLAGQPGHLISRQVRDYRQTTTGQALAASTPLTASRLGHDSGVLLGVNLSTPMYRPVYLDLFANVDRGQSASLAILGEQGAGKSFTQKMLCGATVDRGGRMITTDATAEREWVAFAETLDCASAVADLADPVVSLDPLRLFEPKLAGPVAQSFLATLLNVSSTGPEGRLIAKIVKPSYLTKHGITSMGALAEHLGSSHCEHPLASEVADRIAVFADPDMSGSLGAAVFDAALPVLDVDARAIVIATSTVSQPTAAELEHEHRFATLGPEKIFGRAVYSLIARLAKTVCRADRSDEAVFCVDEFHHYTSPEAVADVLELVRYGRHDRSAVILGTHDPADLSSRVLSSLIRNRLVMRCDPTAAPSYAESLGFSAEENPEMFDDVVGMISSLPPDGAGYGVYRDSNRALAPIRVLRPALEDRYTSILSTPPKKASLQ